MRMQIKILALAALMGPAAVAYAGSAQVTLENQTDMTLDMYVDGAYGCRALQGLTCTAQVQSGVRALEARSGQRTLTSKTSDIAEGSSPVWRVCYTDPNTGGCR
jgi:hypothetical protein